MSPAELLLTITARKLAGTCSNGFERDTGSRWHAVPGSADDYTGAALCGAKPGRRSAGWAEVDEREITCPRCRARLAKLHQEIA